jgi:hypothetical protein
MPRTKKQREQDTAALALERDLGFLDKYPGDPAAASKAAKESRLRAKRKFQQDVQKGSKAKRRRSAGQTGTVLFLT